MRKKIFTFLLALAASVGMSWATTNSITINESSHGSVVASSSSAAAGETITLTATPDDGYQLKSISGVYEAQAPSSETLNSVNAETTTTGTEFQCVGTIAAGDKGWRVYNPGSANTLTISSNDGVTLIEKIELTSAWGKLRRNDMLSVSAGTLSFDGSDPSTTVTINDINATSVTISGSGENAGKTWCITSVKVYYTATIENELEISDTENANVKTFTMVDGEVTISAEFEPAPVLAVANTLQLVADPTKGSVAVTNLLGSGIVDNGDGTYDVPEGAEVTLQATPNEGYEFIGWKAGNVGCDFTDCGNALSTVDNPLTFDMYQEAAFMAEFAAVAPQPEQEGDGKLTGAFTINADGDQILFSKGNLQYQASTTTWRFATNQYDMIGEDNANISDTYTGWIDLFGWGTGNCPTKKSEKDEDYSTFTDWGVNAISNGGNEANLWRTLTIQEWGYLIKTRTNAADLKGQATVADVHGYVLLPDSWTLPAGLSFTASPNNWTTNVYTAEQWTQMEAAGAVFLPATGYREPEIEGVGEKGWYWSSDVLTANAAYNFEFNETTSRVFGSRHYFGQPVRLVTAAPTPTPTPANPSGSCGENLTWEFNTETGALTISGTGTMTSAPWGTYKEDITSLSLPDGLTAIPSEAFKGCTGLTTVTIPASVTSIGADAFLGCESVTDVYCYPKAAGLNWDDYYKDDFIEEHLETRCHVYADEFDGYMDKYADADGVNVTFMNDLEAVAVTTNEDPQNAGAVYYSTYYNSAKKYILPAGCEAYTALLSGDALTLTKIAVGGQTIPNGAAVILKSGSASVTLLPTETDPVSYNAATNSLQGVDEVTTAPANCYVLSCENNLVGFYHYTADKLNAHKAYVIYSGSNQAPRRLRFVFDQATGVESIQPSAVSSQKVLRDGQLVILRNGVEYNAAGQMVK